MTDQPYLDQSGETSDEPGRFVRVDDLEPLRLIDGLEFRPITTDSVMTTFVTFAPDAPAPLHHHVEQQIAIVLSGQLNFTVGSEAQGTLRAGDCVVVPPHVPHGGAASPGWRVVDVFTPRHVVSRG